MRQLWIVAATALMLAGCGGAVPVLVAAATVEELPAARAVEARVYQVVRVIDGDTIRIIYDEQETSLRLVVIDAPERGRAGFTEATDALRDLLHGKRIRIEFTQPTKRDRWGRLLARVWVVGDNGREIDAGAELLRRGLVGIWKP